MIESTEQFKVLEELMDEEIRHYNLLIEEIKEEAKYLRQDSVEPLLKSVNKIDRQREILLKINGAMREKLKIFTNLSELKEETIANSLPPQIYQQWQRHQIKVAKLKERARTLNLQNKAFLQEVLGYWREVRQLIANADNNLSYRWVKDDNQKANPLFLNRRV